MDGGEMPREFEEAPEGRGASVYDRLSGLLRGNGYDVNPVDPRGKWPAVWVPSLRKFQRMLGWTDPKRRAITSPQPNAGIGVRCGIQESGLHLVVFDWDSDALSDLALGSGLSSIVSKVGRRGHSAIFVSRTEVPSEDFLSKDSEVLVEVLGTGSHCVLPPSRHPATGAEYFYLDDPTLEKTRLENLPDLPANYRHIIS